MRKGVIQKALCLLIIMSLVVAVFAACASSTPEPNVTVTVEGGSGGGKYNEGDECTVTADIPAGYKFVEWTVYGMTFSTQNPLKFTVDFDIELTAVYEVVSKTTYRINVEGGIIGDTGLSSAELAEGTVVDIYASESQAREFVKWTVNGAAYTQNPYQLTVTKATDIVAVFNEFCMISVSGGTVDGQRSKIVPAGSDVTVVASAAPDGQRFSYWYTIDDEYNEVKKSEAQSYTFTLGDSVKVYAKFNYFFNINIVNGTVSGSTETELEVEDGSSVTIVPDAAPDNKAFIGWYKDGAKISISKSYSVRVIENMTLEARYGNTSVITLETPTSENNANYPTSGLIYRETGGAVAFDRLTSDHKSTMFVENVEYLAYKIYTSLSANKEDSVGMLKLFVNPQSSDVSTTAILSSSDGEKSMYIRGELGNLYFDASQYSLFENLIKYELGYDYAASQKYYFGVQAMSAEEPVITMESDIAILYMSSGISAISTQAFCENPSAPTGKYQISVINGVLDNGQTSAMVGYGVNVTATAEMPEDDGTDWVFVGWKPVTSGTGGEEILGSTLSKSLSYTFSVTKAITLKAVFADSQSIEYEELPTPNNATNKLIYEEAVGGTLAFDRSGSTCYTAEVEHIVFYLYTSASAGKDEYVGRFIMYADITMDAGGGVNIVGYFTLMDGTNKHNSLRGNPGNYYMIDRNGFNALVQKALGANYNSSTSYYLAAQVIAKLTSDYVDSAISEIGTNGIRF